MLNRSYLILCLSDKLLYSTVASIDITTLNIFTLLMNDEVKTSVSINTYRKMYGNSFHI